MAFDVNTDYKAKQNEIKKQMDAETDPAKKAALQAQWGYKVEFIFEVSRDFGHSNIYRLWERTDLRAGRFGQALRHWWSGASRNLAASTFPPT